MNYSSLESSCHEELNGTMVVISNDLEEFRVENKNIVYKQLYKQGYIENGLEKKKTGTFNEQITFIGWVYLTFLSLYL